MNRPMQTAGTRRGFRQVFGAPIALALLSGIGLVSALVGDGVFDAVSWLTLGIPVAVIGWHLLHRDMSR